MSKVVFCIQAFLLKNSESSNNASRGDWGKQAQALAARILTNEAAYIALQYYLSLTVSWETHSEMGVLLGADQKTLLG